MKHAQTCKIECDLVDCTIPADETCPDGYPSFGVVNTMTPNLGQLGPQEFVAWTAPGPCECYDCKSVYAFNPQDIGFRRQVCFRLGDGLFPTVPLDTKTPGGPGYNGVTIAATNAPACPNGCAGCCGTGRYYITITLRDQLALTTVAGNCGDTTYDVSSGLYPHSWDTSYTLTYCWDSGNPCELALVQIGLNCTIPPNSYGPDAFAGAGCDCGTNVQASCTHTYTLNGCAPFTGDLATVYQLAGSPPMTLYCEECPCENEMSE